MTRPPRPLHIALEGSGDHRASERCPCDPLYLGRDLETAAPAYRHRVPERAPTTRTLARRPDRGDPAA